MAFLFLLEKKQGLKSGLVLIFKKINLTLTRTFFFFFFPYQMNIHFLTKVQTSDCYFLKKAKQYKNRIREFGKFPSTS